MNRSAAWTYPELSNAAGQIKGYVTFWHGVKVVRDKNDQENGLLDRFRSLFG